VEKTKEFEGMRGADTGAR